MVWLYEVLQFRADLIRSATDVLSQHFNHFSAVLGLLDTLHAVSLLTMGTMPVPVVLASVRAHHALRSPAQ